MVVVVYGFGYPNVDIAWLLRLPDLFEKGMVEEKIMALEE